MQERLNTFCEQKKIYRFEGDSGVENLATIVQALGYEPDRFRNGGNVISEFLADNSGAIEAIVNWIGEQNVPEWKAKLDEQIVPVDEDEEEE